MKKILCMIMVLALCFSYVAGAESEKEVKVYTLTLNDAVNMAIADNPQLKSLEIANYSNEINLDAAKINQITYKNYPVTTSAYDIMYIKKGYYVSMYETLIKLNQKETEQAMAKIAYSVTESYYGYKLALELSATAEDAYNLAKENYDNVLKRYELGMIAQIDLDNAALSVESVKNTLDTYKRNAEIAKENLKINLQLDGEDCELILSDGIEYKEVAFNVEEDVEKAMESRYDITALKENYNMAELYLEYTKGLSRTSGVYQAAYSDLVSKEYAYTNTKKLIALSIKNYYNAILNCADNLKLAEKKVDIANKSYDINKIKFESGLITNTELTKSLNEYVSENIGLENAKLNYKMAVEKYQAEIKIGL